MTSDSLDDNADSDDPITQPERKAPSSDKKRSASTAKLDDWVEINSRAYELKREQYQFTRDVERQKLEVDIQREARLAEETKANIRLLTIQAEEAKWKFEHNREMAEVAARVKKIEMRRELKEKGWSDSDIDKACPIYVLLWHGIASVYSNTFVVVFVSNVRIIQGKANAASSQVSITVAIVL
ncbi:hypothetical protein AC1031_017968 [Aphanomyces cochlioides]|nr:hypothetical protein AC1031_017968 [Aphanomyces cochlioides]